MQTYIDKLSKLKENILTYTNISKLSNSLCKLSPNGRLNLTNWSRNTIHAANGIKPVFARAVKEIAESYCYA